MGWFLKKLFGRKTAKRRVPDPGEGIEDEDDFSWFFPPQTLVESAPWDEYWRNQIAHDIAGFVDIFCDDGQLVDAMRSNGLKTVLCVGSGISQEPRALAWAGFDVIALDLSPLAMEVASEWVPPDEFLARLVGARPNARGGSLQFVVSDLCDATCCPGPYDVVIDRKTLQLYPEADRPTAIQAVANRLGSPGIFFSHCHDGTWRPPKEPTHAVAPWFSTEGWPLWRGDASLRDRVAWLFTSTG